MNENVNLLRSEDMNALLREDVGVQQRDKALPIMTILLVAINVIIFMIMINKDGEVLPYTLVKFGAKSNEMIYFYHEYWRLFTSMFLHSGYEHLGINMLVLLLLGSPLERSLGKVRYLGVYLISGIMGSAMSYAVMPYIGVGSSTALFGVFAAIIVYKRFFDGKCRLGKLGCAVFVLLAIDLFVAPFIKIDNYIDNNIDVIVDWSAHVGGVIGGVLTTIICCTPWQHKRDRVRIFIAVALYLALLVGFILYRTYKFMPR